MQKQCRIFVNFSASPRRLEQGLLEGNQSKHSLLGSSKFSVAGFLIRTRNLRGHECTQRSGDGDEAGRGLQSFINPANILFLGSQDWGNKFFGLCKLPSWHVTCGSSVYRPILIQFSPGYSGSVVGSKGICLVPLLSRLHFHTLA